MAESSTDKTDRNRLRDVPLRGTYSNGDDPLRNFYLPVLSSSYRYDRVAGYFSSSVLRAAAVGLRRFIDNALEHGGGMRLIVGAQLSPEDVEAVRRGTISRDEAVRASVAETPLIDVGDDDEVGNAYVQMLAWMVREKLLQIKVGLPLGKDGHLLSPSETKAYFHSKFGILTDTSGDHVAFIGSGNETAAGWIVNHETFSVAKSWKHETWEEQGVEIVERFNRHWNGSPDHHWWVADLADVDDRLLKLVPHDYVLPPYEPGEDVGPNEDSECSDVTEDQLAAARTDIAELLAIPSDVPYTAALTAPATPLPHQSQLLTRAVSTYPRGYLFADPVGFGKTLEVGFTLRELLLSGKARSALILTPASVLRQWQEELAEKVGLMVPRYEAGGFVGVDGEPVPQPPNTNPWSAFPVVLASSHLARRRARRSEVIAGGPWDIVIVDEAHHARRSGSKSTDSPNSLLVLLQAMRDAGSWKALYMATATPMQMYPHEVWDLLELLDLPGRWGVRATDFERYYASLSLDPELRDWGLLSGMVGDYFGDSIALRDTDLEAQIKGSLGAVKARKIVTLGAPNNLQGMPPETAAKMTDAEAAFMDRWLRSHTPMRDRAFRNTRETLRAYQAAGIIPEDVNIPKRHVQDEFIKLNQEWERPLYDRIELYIRRYYNAYMSEGAKALGFIMTVYRRRLTSSFFAIQRSLERRLAALEKGERLNNLLTADDEATVEDSLFEMDNLDVALELLNNEINELREFVTDLQGLSGQDTKATRLIDDLGHALKTFETVVVFTQYGDTMDYVRERLVSAGYSSVGCYSGRGGELWNHETKSWDSVTKTKLKSLFREGHVKVLIGTDSMSEGLNLQTSSRLFNYDMPWNLMRVEQRIGRIDRIGAARPFVEVTNYFYSDTVEEAVYGGIRTGHDDFVDIIGSAQPVLGTIEKAIEHIAMAPEGNTATEVEDAVEKINADIASASDAPVQLDDLTVPEIDIEEPVFEPGISLGGIEERLTRNPLTAPNLRAIGRFPSTYALDEVVCSHVDTVFPRSGGEVLVTFDRDVADEEAIPLLTYGHPLFEALTSLASEG